MSVAAITVSLVAGLASADAAPSPGTPSTPTMPVPTRFLDPATAIGGPRLAAMGVIVDTRSGVPAPPPVNAVSYVIADLDTGEVLAAKAPHATLPPASTIKALTAAYLLPRINRSRWYAAEPGDAAARGTRIGLVPGLSYTGEQLFQALLMGSANDAAYMLARLDGGLPATVAGENELARTLGAADTTVLDPSGLDADGQTSSAYDLALIGRYAMRSAEFRRLVVTKHVDFPGRVLTPTSSPGSRTSASATAVPTMKSPSGPRLTYALDNHNGLLYNYQGTIGIKNGWTDQAHRTFIGAATRDGHTYLVTLMYGVDASQWRPTAQLLDWAFAHGNAASPVGRLLEPGEESPTTSTTTGASSPSTAAVPSDIGGGARAMTPVAAQAVPHALPTGWLELSVITVLLAAVLVASASGWAAYRHHRQPRHQRRH
ncbi:MAG: D-alanyl-D-alanine carboxypeptidase family protein [Nostocoides sp.]